MLSSRLLRRVYCSFLCENVSKLHRKRQKTKNFPIFKDFMHFLLKFRQTSSIGTLKWVIKKETMGCGVCISEEFIAVF